uniref:Uncharacterized protein n=1 Tax=Coccidioides posadasii RMSCC 3488 TaxID=454284 RepID=A0A0J6IMZ4_COCPO|nr:hypothetical protein CPAG_09581 [Coccidioides posadasii RMSCC 3488]
MVKPGKSASACAFSAVGCSILSRLCARPITHLIGRPGSGNLVSSTRNGGSSVARNGNKPQSQERGKPTVNLWLNPTANNETTCGWGAGIGPGITTALGQAGSRRTLPDIFLYEADHLAKKGGKGGPGRDWVRAQNSIAMLKSTPLYHEPQQRCKNTYFVYVEECVFPLSVLQSNIRYKSLRVYPAISFSSITVVIRVAVKAIS